MEQDYVPFGKEWKKEMMLWKKEDLIEHLRKQLMERLEGEASLISFGSYLLSTERAKTIRHEEVRDRVGHHDLENWKHLKSNISNQ
jgi:hypothetical protein